MGRLHVFFLAILSVCFGIIATAQTGSLFVHSRRNFHASSVVNEFNPDTTSVDDSESKAVEEAINLLQDSGVDISGLCHPTSKNYQPRIPLCNSGDSTHRLLEESTESETINVYFSITMSLVCVIVAAIAAGLTMGLLSLDPLELVVKQRASNSETEREMASAILPLVNDHHRLLVSLLLLNTIANESLPIFLDKMVPEYVAIILSVTLLLLVGEIIPSALCSGPDQLKIAARMVPIVKLTMFLLAPLAWPIAKLLDYFLHHDEDKDGKYDRNELAALVRLMHEERIVEKARRKKNMLLAESSKTSLSEDDYLLKNQDLSINDDSYATMGSDIKTSQYEKSDTIDSIRMDEVKVVEGALQMQTKTVNDIFTPWVKVRCVPTNMLLNKTSVKLMVSYQKSRLPVYEKGDDTKAIRGVFMIQQLIPLSPDNVTKLTIGDMDLYRPFCVSTIMTLADLLSLLQRGGNKKKEGGHLALVCENPELANEAFKKRLAIPSEANILGVVTLEDAIEEIIQEEIYDEADNFDLSCRFDTTPNAELRRGLV